jgi:urease accessory protein
MSTTSFLILQLADGAFPSGGFAHSGGLEAALHLRGVGDLEPFVDEALWQTARGALPFVRHASERPARLSDLDSAFDATSTSHVANRASRALGRALASAASRIFERPDILAIGVYARSGPAHHAPVFGAVFGALGVSPLETQAAWLHGVVRGVLSAAVRLGIVGPLEAQQVLATRAPLLERILASCTDLEPDQATQTSPLLELFGALHDRLDGRLFQS